MDQLSNYPHLSWYISNLRSIPGGQFHWGASPFEEELGIPITMSPFRMGTTPITVGIWKEYCKATIAEMPAKPAWGYPDNHPVVNVSWEDIMNPGGFCEWASGVSGFKLTLPTDAQYEYAARGGQDELEYPWGNDFDKSKLWCETLFDRQGKTAAVDRTDRTYRNGYGLTDMVGNVCQWCADYYNEDYRPNGKDPVDSEMSDLRYVRGGSWEDYDPGDFRCADRNWSGRNNWGNMIGFRLSAGQK